MKEFRQKGSSVSDEDFMICILNNLSKEDDVILDGLENHLMATGDDALTIDSIRKKMNHRYNKIKCKKEEEIEKEKALGVHDKQYKQRCRKCGKYGHKPGDWRCPENKNKKEENNKKTGYKNRKFDGICYHCGEEGHISRDCRAQKNGYYKKLRKQKRLFMEMRTIWCYVHC